MADRFKELREALAAVKRAPSKFEECPARERLRWSAEAYAEELLAALDAAEARARDIERKAQEDMEAQLTRCEKHQADVYAIRDQAEAQRDRAQARVRRLEEALGMTSTWPIASVLDALVGAVEHLLGDHNCDCHGHERRRYAVQAAGDMLTKLRAALADGADKEG